jgi:hypothetical protein
LDLPRVARLRAVAPTSVGRDRDDALWVAALEDEIARSRHSGTSLSLVELEDSEQITESETLPEASCAREPNPEPVPDDWAAELAIGALQPNSPVAGQVWAPEHVCGRGDAEVARLAGHQHGVVSRAQLLGAGLTRRAIAHRVAVGRLYVMHKGVYLVGRASPELWSGGAAAILFFGGHAVLSHRYAAALWGIIEAPPEEVSVTLVSRDRRARPGLEIHRTAAMAGADLRLRSDLPITAPARTLLDLAAVLGSIGLAGP